MTTDHRRGLGELGERLAAEHLQRLGYEVVARNHRTRFGELDLVVADEETLVFVEVKTRRVGRGSPWDSLHERKQQRVRARAAAYLREAGERPFRDLIRFDAIGVVVDAVDQLVKLDHLEGAF